ncbi:MAG: hypothetical protein AAF663_02810 [Planctomycetota bacterium]
MKHQESPRFDAGFFVKVEPRSLAAMDAQANLNPSRDWPLHWLHGQGVSMSWLPDGTLRGVWSSSQAIEGDPPDDAIRVNNLLGDPVGGGPMRLLLRGWRSGTQTSVFDALRDADEALFSADQTTAAWRGKRYGMSWRATVRVEPEFPSCWTWVLKIQADAGVAGGAVPESWDAILVQDLALASEAAARNNEKYVGQYLDLRIEPKPSSEPAEPTLLARQGLPQPGGTHPALVAVGTNLTSVMTDLVAFYGTEFKATDSPNHAHTPTLPHGVLQHETPAAILQSSPQPLQGETHSTSTGFGFQLIPDHPAATGPEDLSVAEDLRAWLVERVANQAVPNGLWKPAPRNDRPAIVSSNPPSEIQLADWFGPPDNWRHTERDHDGSVLSFFHGPDRHVATRAKDDTLRRGHGHILRTGQAFLPDDRSVCCTVYQHGIFASQLTVGNTTFGQLCAVARDPINLNCAAGLRLLVDFGNGSDFVQLGQAGAFEMAPGWCRWWYVLGDRVVRVSAAAATDGPTLRYEVEVVAGGPVRFALRQHVSIGELEDRYATSVVYDATSGTVTAKPADATDLPWIAREYPELTCRWRFDRPDQIDRLENASAGSYWKIETTPSTSLAWTITASPEAEYFEGQVDTFCSIRGESDAYWQKLYEPVCRPVEAASRSKREADLSRLRDAVPWMTHNAMIHLSVPHGLEQFGGAAWGTRDVCQGPTEMLRAVGRSDVLADVLRVVFRHQHIQTGDWPQWFMHPPFHAVQASESHGDVVIWPMYALAHYLEMGGEAALLDEPIAWTDREQDFAFTEQTATIRDHVKRAIDRIIGQRIPGTALPRYGHGDWNDALQPAQQAFTQRMVSCWTVALLADTLQRLADELADSDSAWSAELARHAQAVRDDFNRWCLVPDSETGQQLVAGLLLFDESFTSAEPLLHPADQSTGIRHSLIPMNRALIAGLFDKPLASHHRRVIEEKLLAPDGVRLMERPPVYTGGLSSVFQRAESAAFFGREVGLMYTHAHLRTVESLIVDGQPEAAMALLNRVNPVGLTDAETGVANAAPRQANAYFSSSDARFATRYEADEDHVAVFEGRVTCDGGWRIYSSGPGIFLWLVRRAAEALANG